MGILFDIIPVLVLLMFVFTFGMIIVTTIRGIAQWNKNNHSPRLTVDATIITKRTNVARRRRAGSSVHHTHTTYYATFQVESGDRFELELQGMDYGLLVEGDRGRLSFQGTRFLGFQRT